MNKHQKESPRYDLLTGEPIKFKNREQYAGSFYNNRNNLVRHFKGLDPDKIKEITTQILISRAKAKNIVYAMSTVECKSIPIPCPSPALVEALNLDYNEISRECQLVPKYEYKDISLGKVIIPKKIIVDTREQILLDLGVATEIRKLDFGDYALGENLENSVVIEKKNASDFVSTLSQGFERFYRELERAKNANAKMLILVDNTLAKMLSFNYLPQFKWTKASPEFSFSRLRELLQYFDNVQVAFVDGKKKSAEMAKFVLGCGTKLFKYDIQFLLDTKRIVL